MSVPMDLDGMQKRIALKEAELNALRFDMSKSMQVLQESKSALLQSHKVIERQHELDLMISAANSELQKRLSEALQRANSAEEKVHCLEQLNARYEQLLENAKTDMVFFWRLRGGNLIEGTQPLSAEAELAGMAPNAPAAAPTITPQTDWDLHESIRQEYMKRIEELPDVAARVTALVAAETTPVETGTSIAEAAARDIMAHQEQHDDLKKEILDQVESLINQRIASMEDFFGNEESVTSQPGVRVVTPPPFPYHHLLQSN